MSFECPVHGAAHRCFVPSRTQLEGQPEVRNHLWQRTGDTFEALTLTPSVDYTKYDNGTVRDPTCWHGHITEGEIR